MMEYQSTRNPELHATAAQAVLQGLAPDGGLYTMPSLAQGEAGLAGCFAVGYPVHGP